MLEKLSEEHIIFEIDPSICLIFDILDKILKVKFGFLIIKEIPIKFELFGKVKIKSPSVFKFFKNKSPEFFLKSVFEFIKLIEGKLK